MFNSRTINQKCIAKKSTLLFTKRGVCHTRLLSPSTFTLLLINCSIILGKLFAIRFNSHFRFADNKKYGRSYQPSLRFSRRVRHGHLFLRLREKKSSKLFGYVCFLWIFRAEIRIIPVVKRRLVFRLKHLYKLTETMLYAQYSNWKKKWMKEVKLCLNIIFPALHPES